LGHKRIAYIGLTDDLYTMRMRHDGYIAAMEAAGLKPCSAFLSVAPDDSRAVLRKLLSGARPPTAIFCANNLTTRHVLRSLQSMNRHPPDSIALVGFDDFETADLMRPGITVVRQPSELLGRTAAEVLFERLATGGAPKLGERIVLPVELVVRGSCGAKVPVKSK
jgi:LacI family transcriptional regulator